MYIPIDTYKVGTATGYMPKTRNSKKYCKMEERLLFQKGGPKTERTQDRGRMRTREQLSVFPWG